MMPYSIVEFTQSQSCEIVATTWLNDEEDQCRWPPGSNLKAAKLALKGAEPDASWQVFPVRVLGKAATYKRAREKLAKSEKSSDINTDVEQEQPNKKRARHARTFSSDSEEESTTAGLNHLPPPPSPRPPPPRRRHCSPPAHCPPPTLPPPPPPILNVPTQQTSGHQAELPSDVDIQGNALPPILVADSSSLRTDDDTPGLSSSLVNGTPPSITSRESQTSVATPRLPSRTPPPTPSNSSSVSAANETSVARSPAVTLILRALTVLEEIRETQRVHGSAIQAILRQLGNRNNAAELPEGLSLPLRTMTEFDDFEEKATDQSFQKAMVAVLGDIGGNGVENVVVRIMSFLMKTDLAIQFNLCGLRNKRAFNKTNTFPLIFRGVKKNPPTSTANKKDVEVALAKWFSGARDRDGRRAHRLKKTQGRTSLAPEEPECGDDSEIDEGF